MGSYDRAKRREEMAHWRELDYQYRKDCEEKGVKPYDPEREKYEGKYGAFWGPVVRYGLLIVAVGALMAIILVVMGSYRHL